MINTNHSTIMLVAIGSGLGVFALVLLLGRLAGVWIEGGQLWIVRLQSVQREVLWHVRLESHLGAVTLARPSASSG